MGVSMSEVRGNHLFTAEIAGDGPLAAARLVEFLGLLDAVYRSVRWMTFLNEEALAPLEDSCSPGRQ